MNCDDAFDCLTDPARNRKRELAAHLAACPRCRQMREVLEPALALFDPASATRAGVDGTETGLTDSPFAESKNAPLVTPEIVLLAQKAAARLNRGARSERALLRRMVALSVRYTAALAIGACLAFGVAGLSEDDPSPGVAAAACIWTDEREPDATLELHTPALVSTCVACHLEGSASETGTEGGLNLPPASACPWQLAHGAQPASQASTERSEARGVVVSCVACHLEKAERDVDSSRSAGLFPRGIEALESFGATARIVSIDRMKGLPRWSAECASWVNQVIAVTVDDRTFARGRA